MVKTWRSLGRALGLREPEVGSTVLLGRGGVRKRVPAKVLMASLFGQILRVEMDSETRV